MPTDLPPWAQSWPRESDKGLARTAVALWDQNDQNPNDCAAPRQSSELNRPGGGGTIGMLRSRSSDTSDSVGGTLTAGFHVNDMVATLSQTVVENGANVVKGQDFTLDVAGRLSVTKNVTVNVSLKESTNHYDSGDDSPAWKETKTRGRAWKLTAEQFPIRAERFKIEIPLVAGFASQFYQTKISARESDIGLITALVFVPVGLVILGLVHFGRLPTQVRGVGLLLVWAGFVSVVIHFLS